MGQLAHNALQANQNLQCHPAAEACLYEHLRMLLSKNRYFNVVSFYLSFNVSFNVSVDVSFNVSVDVSFSTLTTERKS